MPHARKSRGAIALIAVAATVLAGCRGLGRSLRQPGEPQAAVSPPANSRADWPRTFVDDLGNVVKLPAPAQRVVSLSPNMAEIVCFVGAADKLVGVTDFCDYPPEAAAKPKVGGIINPSLEKIIALQPDLVLAAQGNDITFLERLRAEGIAVYAAKPQTLDDVIELVETVGALLGLDKEARRRADELRRRAEQLQRFAAELQTQPRALCVIEVDPLFVAGPGSFIDDLLRRARMANAVQQGREWTRWSAERLIAANPDIVILVRGPHSASRGLATASPWRELAAVQAGMVFEVDEDLLTIPGPRLVDGLAKLIEIHRQYEAAVPAASSSGGGRARGPRPSAGRG